MIAVLAICTRTALCIYDVEHLSIRHFVSALEGYEGSGTIRQHN
jgi:hypothetical protein